MNCASFAEPALITLLSVMTPLMSLLMVALETQRRPVFWLLIFLIFYSNVKRKTDILLELVDVDGVSELVLDYHKQYFCPCMVDTLFGGGVVL